MRRPSYSELEKKLKMAKELLKEGKVLFCDNNKVDREILDLAQLGIEGEEIHELLVDCLSEILSGNVSKSYEDANGRYPPTVSVEPQASGKEYWPFCWTSELGPFKGKHMYLKFVLLKESYLYLSLHEDDKGRKK